MPVKKLYACRKELDGDSGLLIETASNSHEIEESQSTAEATEIYFAVISTEARVVSQSICREHPEPDFA